MGALTPIFWLVLVAALITPRRSGVAYRTFELALGSLLTICLGRPCQCLAFCDRDAMCGFGASDGDLIFVLRLRLACLLRFAGRVLASLLCPQQLLSRLRHPFACFPLRIGQIALCLRLRIRELTTRLIGRVGLIATRKCKCAAGRDPECC